MADTRHSGCLRVSSFNCRSIKSSLLEVKELCSMSHFVFLQEHWLLPCDLSSLNDVHADFLGTGHSAVDLSDGVLVGRPYGGTAILFHKILSPFVKIIETNDPRLTAVRFESCLGPILFICVYMPTDTGDHECLENYIDTCCRINALYSETDVVHAIIGGDFNCQLASRFYDVFTSCATASNLELSDLKRLDNVFTFCSDSGLRTSWIDHFLCSRSVDSLISHVEILHQFITSDHKPMHILFQDLYGEIADSQNSPTHSPSYVYDWSKASQCAITNYQCLLNELLRQISIPSVVLQNDAVYNRQQVDGYYNKIIGCIKTASWTTIPHHYRRPGNMDNIVAGWNDIVRDKHGIARAAYLDWVAEGRPRGGPLFSVMSRTRAAFKLALRYCRDHEDRLRADAMGKNLLDKDFRSFWRNINKQNNGNSTKYANTIGGCSGDQDITEMWRKHFVQLYNSVEDDGFKMLFYDRLTNVNSHAVSCTVHQLLECVDKQKSGKAVGPDGIAMEAIINGGVQLSIHLSILFSLFIELQYLPANFMRSDIIPLVKSKSGDLADVNNYRAIAISTSMSKLFECVIAGEVSTYSEYDMYQFGFKAGHSTGLCTNVLKNVVDYYTCRGSYVFACFIDFTKAFDRVNYWKLFNKLLDDGVNGSVIAVLAYWYSHQEVCVRWRNSVSNSFYIGNGTRQGGILSPSLFSRYIRDLLAEIASVNVGCNIGGLFINVLAYADDIVVLAPSWSALQKLLSALEQHITSIDMVCNSNKSVCMIFEPRDRTKVMNVEFPQFMLAGCLLQYVQVFKYLGHIISDTLADDDDLHREIRNLFTRTNILARRFAKCSVDVKIALFKAYCVCLYDAGLWLKFRMSSLNKLSSCYNKCLKLFFGYKRRDSVTQILFTLGLPSFNTIVHNSKAVIRLSWSNSCNTIVRHLNSLLCMYS